MDELMRRCLMAYVAGLNSQQLDMLDFFTSNYMPEDKCGTCDDEIDYLEDFEESRNLDFFLHVVKKCIRCKNMLCSDCTMKCFQCDAFLCKMCSKKRIKKASYNADKYVSLCDNCTKKYCEDCGDRYYGKYHIGCCKGY